MEWYKDNEKVTFNEITYYSEYTENTEDYGDQERVILNADNSISIQNTKKGDIGSYFCHINTGVGTPLGETYYYTTIISSLIRLYLATICTLNFIFISLVLEAGTLYKKAAWWWILIVVLVIIGLLGLIICLVIHYIRNLQRSGKYVVKRKKDSENTDISTAQIL